MPHPMLSVLSLEEIGTCRAVEKERRATVVVEHPGERERESCTDHWPRLELLMQAFKSKIQGVFGAS